MTIIGLLNILRNSLNYVVVSSIKLIEFNFDEPSESVWILI